MGSFELVGIGYVEFYVTNAFQSAIFYKEALGFDIVGIRHLEKGISYLLKQNECFLILTSSFDKNSLIHEHVLKHGDSIKDITFLAKNIDLAYDYMMKRGADVINNPSELRESSRGLRKYSINAFGDLTHSFVEYSLSLDNMPFYKSLNHVSSKKYGLQKIDHIAIALKREGLEEGISFYRDIFGFHVSHEEEVILGKGGMSSVVMSSVDDQIKFPLVSPIGEIGHSQIDKYLTYNEGVGAQHIAFLSNDIVESAKTLKESGISFLEIPQSYYENISSKISNSLNSKMDQIRELGILLSGEEDHLLMQIFSTPLQTLPTFFIEIIERNNNQGFGSENIKALFKAVALDQQKENI